MAVDSNAVNWQSPSIALEGSMQQHTSTPIVSAGTHPAILRAQEIYDRPGDLASHEQTLLSAVHRITTECTRTKGEAIQAWGDGSRAFAAVAFLAERKQADRLSCALERYEQAVEAGDEVLEIELADAVAAE
jgi:hypothetical protein